MMAGIGAGIRPALPVTGTTLIMHHEGVDGIVSIAETDDRVRKALVAALKYGGYIQLGGYIATVSIAVAVDVGRLHPDSLPARARVGDVIDQLRKEQELYGDKSGGAGNAAQNGAAPGAPKAWQPVGAQGKVG